MLGQGYESGARRPWRNEEEFEQLGAQSSSYDGGDGGDGIEDSFPPLNPAIVSGKGSWSGR